MDSRRDFLKKAALVTGGTGLVNSLPASIIRALSIDPVAGSTYMDAEHVVILMQENRSFDHCFGSLRGVRGFNDPRAILLPDNDPVWFQKDANGDAYPPFRLNIRETKSTWTGSLPHSWTNQVDARNEGRFDKWLIAKPSGHKEFAKAPLTMGYYNREDIPFYYALADAFTVCDQNFCSSLTGTTPNRLFLWSGTVRDKQNESSYANVRNETVDYSAEVNWKTFPERLEEHNVSWKIYQNELSIPSGLSGEEDAWLANFTDNPLEWFTRYNVRFSVSHRRWLAGQLPVLPAQIANLEEEISASGNDEKKIARLKKILSTKKDLLEAAKLVKEHYTDAKFENLSATDKSLHKKAFTTNAGDKDYRSIDEYKYSDNGVNRSMNLPKGDILHQFRADVDQDKLPTVSWLIGPENFSDHPGAPWYGAWYVSEVLDILTKKPDTWKKTIFILCYDENDGYFDHIPPFVPPNPYKAGTGLTSKNIDTRVEYVTLEQDMKRHARKESRESAIGLGYRVPLVIASPWSRGGQVCSQVFDHTSILQFLEKFLSARTGKELKEENISSWRRSVCGDLTSVFQPFNNQKINFPLPLPKNKFYESVHKAQFLKDPDGYYRLSTAEVSKAAKNLRTSGMLPQEPGTRAACALPYELYVDGNVDTASGKFVIKMQAGNKLFGKASAGAPYIVYASKPHKHLEGEGFDPMRVWNYTVGAGDQLTDAWHIDDFRDGVYGLRVYGPNGFYRHFAGDKNDPLISIECRCAAKNTKLQIIIINHSRRKYTLQLSDPSYSNVNKKLILDVGGTKGGKAVYLVPTTSSFGWYDVIIAIDGYKEFVKHFAGHIESGLITSTDPAMGIHQKYLSSIKQ
jgi:phospholipase C